MATYTLNSSELRAVAEGTNHDRVCGLPRPHVPDQTCARKAGHIDPVCMSAEHLAFLARAASGEDFPWLKDPEEQP